MVKLLTWALLNIDDTLPDGHMDKISSPLAQIHYGIFTILGGILLMNMMIALLSNAYQEVEVNFR